MTVVLSYVKLQQAASAFMRFKRIRKVMAGSREGVYDSSDESSDTIQDATSEYSTSSESETDEEDLTEATTSSGGRKRSIIQCL